MKSKKFDKVKKFFDSGLWSTSRVQDAVAKKWITAEEFELITGIPYSK